LLRVPDNREIVQLPWNVVMFYNIRICNQYSPILIRHHKGTGFLSASFVLRSNCDALLKIVLNRIFKHPVMFLKSNMSRKTNHHSYRVSIRMFKISIRSFQQYFCYSIPSDIQNISREVVCSDFFKDTGEVYLQDHFVLILYSSLDMTDERIKTYPWRLEQTRTGTCERLVIK